MTVDVAKHKYMDWNVYFSETLTCKETYPDSLDVSEIGMRTGWKINKLLIDDLVNDGIIEWDDLTAIKLNG